MTKRKRGKDISIAEEKDPFFFSGVAALKERERDREREEKGKKKNLACVSPDDLEL